MKKAVLAFLLLLALPLAACKPPAASPSFPPLYYESEEAFVKDVALAREEHSAGVKAEDLPRPVTREEEQKRLRAMYRLHERTFYFRLTEVPQGFSLHGIFTNNSGVSASYARTDAIGKEETGAYSKIVVDYSEMFTRESAERQMVIQRNAGSYTETRAVDGRTYYILHIGEKESAYNAKSVFAEVNWDMLTISAPYSMSDEDIIKLFDQVVKVPIP